MPGRPSTGRMRLRPIAWLAARAALVAVVPLTIAAAVLAIEDGFEPGSGFVVGAMTVCFILVASILVVGLSDLRAADARTRDALARAAFAEAAQRTRADELARVLAASESLAFTGEGQVDYLGVLQAITPEGATSFIVRVEGDTEGIVVAAHGPLAASVVGVRRPLPSAGGAATSSTVPVASFSASGRIVGRAMPKEHLAGVESEVEAALTVPLMDHGGNCLGWLHMLDHRGERILEPTFVSLFQLVAIEICVAMENNALLGRVRRQLVVVKRVQQQLVEASKRGAVGELAAAVAHEVNNPLTGILGFSELLMSELPEDDARRGEAAVIRDEAIRARSIVQALLELARPRLPQRIRTSLNDLTRSTLELVRYRAAQDAVEVVADYGDVPCLEIDPDAVKQVMLNLFNNAIDAMPVGGILHVTTVSDPDRVGVVVADGGIGMDRETRSRIFTPFFSTRAGPGGGTGIGLSVSLQIVESHGGTIDVESAPGRGSVFTVWLPSAWGAFDGSVLIPGTETTARPADATPNPDSGQSTRARAVPCADPKTSAAPAPSEHGAVA